MLHRYIIMNTRHKNDLLTVILDIKQKDILEKFLIDILTPSEWEDIIKRWQIVKQLSNRTPQRTIAKNLGVSIAKITRGSRELRDKKGGFWQALKMKK